MQLTGMRTKYYLLSVVALVVAFVVLAMLPSPAQAQAVTVDKECNPNPVQIGGQLTCIIDVEPASPQTVITVEVRDAFPAGIRPTVATQEQIVNDEVVTRLPCPVAGNTVRCPIGVVTGETFGESTIRVTIAARAEQCGTFTNTAEALRFPVGTVAGTDTEAITVEGCRGGGAGQGPGGQQQQPNQQQGSPAPITQEGEQESEAGEIDQSFDVS